MTKNTAYAILRTRKGIVSWLANIIFCHHTNPARRLRNLLRVSDRVVSGDFEGITLNGAGRLSWAEFEAYKG